MYFFKAKFLGAGLIILLASLPATAANENDFNVVWRTPSTNSSGSMPLGNGDIGLNVWAEPGGDLLFYISKSDAWDENGRLVKIGKVRVKFSPNPFRRGLPFRQELKLAQGEIEIQAGPPNSSVKVRVWVDANAPVIRMEAESPEALTLQASSEIWRTAARKLIGEEADGVDRFSQNEPPISYPDTVVTGLTDRVVWYHRNTTSVWSATLRHQGLAGLIKDGTDPLLHRTFGAAITGEGLERVNELTLRSTKPARQFRLLVHPLTTQSNSGSDWLAELNTAIAKTGTSDWEGARARHQAWWGEFWNRSWLRITGSTPQSGIAEKMQRNHLPVRIGADSGGNNRFLGEIGGIAIYNRALTQEEILAQALGHGPGPDKLTGTVAAWVFDDLITNAFQNHALQPLLARPVGSVLLSQDRGDAKALLLSGKGYLEVEHAPALDLEDAITLEAWIRPDRLPSGGRIIDKSEAGTANGYCLDTYPGNSLRFIVADGPLTYDAKLPTNRWAHVVAVFDARSGEKKLYLDGKVVTSGGADIRDPEHQVVSQGYALQRFISASAGRGAYPIKFNGSLFTVDVPGKFDGDYRRWGGCYWFQNTRLEYWPMLGSGDFEMMQPLFRMYLDALPFAQARTESYFHHGGAFFPETMHFWGAYHNGEFGYGWNREGEPVNRTANKYIRYYWCGGLELTAMMLDHYSHTEDSSFLNGKLLPLSDAILEFYAKHYPREPGGKILFAPAQSLETWWECENPTPEVAGLYFVLDKLLELPTGVTGESRVSFWKELREQLPRIPTRQVGTNKFLLPAESYRHQQNVENPELYTVFPFRVYGLGKPELEMARTTFELRQFKGHVGWQQDDTQAGFLGLADQARRMVAQRFAAKDPGSRFPAFWGPNFDWVPDQDHGASGLMALQTMLLQAEGKKIYLFPAWPKAWEVEFKLRAPYNTTVQGTYRAGKVESLTVTPSSRRADLIQLEPQ